MKRRAVLGMIGVGVVSSGVLGDPAEHTDRESLAERFECEAPSRPACNPGSTDVDRTDDGTGPEPYPDPPAAVDDVLAFVRDHERAYAKNEVRCSRERPERLGDYRIEFDDVERFDWYDGIHVVRVRYAETVGSADDGVPWATTDGYGGAVYGVDETAAVRTGLSLGPSGTLPSEAGTPDPVASGTLVDCF
ncbi:hypothetical protein [Natronococcus occultus]|uniref:Uncharacterized protein n=1 Tax=Natronococcus occultus SP4 TaxID=694430 RepID=L0JZA7_9EURY|nr:hypothetical protein [Natronococcus occultus]AGB37640.1 hypothetical protein Natoc_1846 [Natronococcus occultus SP4]